MALSAETNNWMVDYGMCCNRKYSSEMDQIFALVEEAGKKLNRQINDLDDVRIAMATLKEIREKQISVDFQLGPIEVTRNAAGGLRPFSLTGTNVPRLLSLPLQESYTMLNKYELSVAKEEADKVDTLRYTWEKLLSRATEVQNTLVEMQPNFKGELVSNVDIFLEDCENFYKDYENVSEQQQQQQTGPRCVTLTEPVVSVPGWADGDRVSASGRQRQTHHVSGTFLRSSSGYSQTDELGKNVVVVPLQNRFDNLHRKYITYTSGEELFGLPVTQHPQLLFIKKQLALLQKLYSLYNSVIKTVNGYNDILWADINIEKINNELLEFQTRSEHLKV